MRFMPTAFNSAAAATAALLGDTAKGEAGTANADTAKADTAKADTAKADTTEADTARVDTAEVPVRSEGAPRLPLTTKPQIAALVAAQNVEVLTEPFSTAIARYNEVHEALGEESEETKEMRTKDDPDIVPDRKLHKILVRLRFRGVEQKGGVDAPWVFFIAVRLDFSASSVNHEATVVMRCALKADRGRIGDVGLFPVLAPTSAPAPKARSRMTTRAAH